METNGSTYRHTLPNGESDNFIVSPAPAEGVRLGPPQEEYREVRQRTRLIQARRRELLETRLEEMERKKSERSKNRDLMESCGWGGGSMGGYDWLSAFMNAGDMVDGIDFGGATQFWQRKYGRNYPFYQNEIQLQLLRMPSRILLGQNNFAIGLMEGRLAYLCDTGFSWRFTSKEPNLSEDEKEGVDEIAHACQEILDEFHERTQWWGGRWHPSIEDEFIWRSAEDGETHLIAYALADGRTDVRFAEPEQCTAPPGFNRYAGMDAKGKPVIDQMYDEKQSREWPYNWLFGICTPKDDAEKYLSFWYYFGDTPSEGQEYDPEDVVYHRRNAKRKMKRGLPDFSFYTLDSLEQAGRLNLTITETAAEQAAIRSVMEYEQGTSTDVASSLMDFDLGNGVAGSNGASPTPPATSIPYGPGNSGPRTRRGRTYDEHIPKGQTYVAGPIAQSTPIHLDVLNRCLLGAGVRYNAPPWMIGTNEESSYANSLSTGSPFVKTTQRDQAEYARSFEAVGWIVIRNWCRKYGGVYVNGVPYDLWKLKKLLQLEVKGSSPEVRDKQKEAAIAAIEIPLNVQSRPAYCAEQGRDYKLVNEENEQYIAEHGGAGDPLAMPADGAGGDGGGTANGGGGTDQTPPPGNKPPGLSGQTRFA